MGNFFRRNAKQAPMSDLSAAIANGCAQAAAGRQSGDEEQKKNLAENYLLMTDGNLENLLRGMSQYAFIDKGNLMGGGEGKEYIGAIPKNMAISIMNTHLIRTGWLTEKQARIMQFEAHRIFTRRKMSMTEDEYEEGGGLVMDSENMVLNSNINASVNGRMAKLVKSRPHSIDVNVGSTKQETQ